MWLAVTKGGSVVTLVWLKRCFVTRQKAEFAESRLHNGGNIWTLFLLDNCMTQGWMGKNNCVAQKPHMHYEPHARCHLTLCSLSADDQHSTVNARRTPAPSSHSKNKNTSTVIWLRTYTPLNLHKTGRKIYFAPWHKRKCRAEPKFYSVFKPGDFNPPKFIIAAEKNGLLFNQIHKGNRSSFTFGYFCGHHRSQSPESLGGGGVRVGVAKRENAECAESVNKTATSHSATSTGISSRRQEWWRWNQEWALFSFKLIFYITASSYSSAERTV